MAIKGLSIPVCGSYSAVGNTVTYSNPYRADKAIEYGVSWTTSDDNPLFADNGIAENDFGTFQNGELSLGTSELTQEMSKKVLGIRTSEFMIGEVTVTEGVYDDEQKAPILGFGIIEWHQINNVDKYRAVFFPKVIFKIPEEAATTKGENVEWQTKTITGTIMRSDQVDDKYKHPWMMDAWLDTKADALTYLEYKCGKITEVTNG